MSDKTRPYRSSRLWQVCPVCEGTGLVSRPPGVPADQATWVSGGAGPYGCRTCNGETILLTPTDENDPSRTE